MRRFFLVFLGWFLYSRGLFMCIDVVRMSETAMLLQAYAKEPIARYVMNDCDISQEQSNSVCGDSLTVYIKIKEKKILERSREGPTEMQTTAAASILWECIQWESLATVLSWTYAFIRDLWLDLSPRRRRSGVTALLATKNALHSRLEDGILETYDDLLSLS
jgi:NifU-like protein involved in Fe-S cluster formation